MPSGAPGEAFEVLSRHHGSWHGVTEVASGAAP